MNLAQGVNLLIEDRCNDLSDGQAEIALRAGPPGNDSLIGRKLSDQSWAVYGSRSYVERSGRQTTPDDLNDRIRRADRNITPARWLRAMAPDCEIACRSNSVLGLLFAIQSGFGLGLLPCQIGDAEEDIVRVIDPQPGLIGGFWILTHPDLHKRPKIRAFFDFMLEEIVKYRPLLLGQTQPSRGNQGRSETAAASSSTVEPELSSPSGGASRDSPA